MTLFQKTERNKMTIKQKFFDTLQILRGLGVRECDLDEIIFAYDIAHYAHLTQKRDDGEDYISHPVEGCLTMARDYHINNPLLYITFLFHDVGEDTTIFGDREILPWWKFIIICTNRVTRLFGPRVAELVVTLTKPGKIDGGWETKDEMMEIYLKKLAGDYHAILLKMIDRLHNLRSLPSDDSERIRKQVNETKLLLLPVFKKGIQIAKEVGDVNCVRSMLAIIADIKHRIRELNGV